jgi:hypothetical protein
VSRWRLWINRERSTLAMETDDDSSLDPDVRRQWDDMPNIYTEDNRQSGEQVSNDVKIWSVKAGVLATHNSGYQYFKRIDHQKDRPRVFLLWPITATG